ncbi:MAG: hypothetical protein K0S45_4497 [Nitrospira sp.]|jgi:hypothetical protein|nr:hypothetical protein [Nitrospira sp.]
MSPERCDFFASIPSTATPRYEARDGTMCMVCRAPVGGNPGRHQRNSNFSEPITVNGTPV